MGGSPFIVRRIGARQELVQDDAGKRKHFNIVEQLPEPSSKDDRILREDDEVRKEGST